MKNVPIIVLFTVLIAFILRVYNLGSNPPAAYGDEISFAWNAWNILKTGTDEYGQPYPLQFRAFDDYKAPVPVYLLVPFIKLLGLNTFAVRLPVAIFSALTIWVIYLIGKELFNQKVGILTSMLMAISPWHQHLSRGYFESTIALFFLITAVYFFITANRNPRRLIYSALFFGLTLYTYFTPRIMLLIFIPFIFWIKKDWLSEHKKYAFYFTLIVVVISLPLFKLILFDKGASRINKLTESRNVSINKEVILDRNSVNSPPLIKNLLHNRQFYWIRDVTDDYLEQLSPNFLFLYGDSSLRYFLGNIGMMYLFELPFLVIGLCSLLRQIREHNKTGVLLLGWLVIAPIPAAISGRPFAVRSLAMLPPLIIFTAIGIIRTLDRSILSNWINLVKGTVVIGFVLSLGYYLVRYHLEYPTYAATWWGWENKAAIDLALKNQDKYDKIFISNFYSGADLAYAFYTACDPLVYRNALENQVVMLDNRHLIQLGKFYIGSLDIDENRLKSGIIPPKTLYIGRPEEVESNETIKAPDDKRILFNIYRTN